MRISEIFAQGGGYGYGGGSDSGYYDNNDFRGRGDADYFTGLRETRNGDYRRYDDETDLL
ncbi:MAG: hypothetical protein ACRDTA_22465 [Pseudonocardiaceae bacterium]